MFGDNGLPLGPNGQFPPQRINSFGNDVAAPRNQEETYLMSDEVQLPVYEKDYTTSVDNARRRVYFGGASPAVEKEGVVGLSGFGAWGKRMTRRGPGQMPSGIARLFMRLGF